jgi:hypothetical protein
MVGQLEARMAGPQVVDIVTVHIDACVGGFWGGELG